MLPARVVRAESISRLKSAPAEGAEALLAVYAMLQGLRTPDQEQTARRGREALETPADLSREGVEAISPDRSLDRPVGTPYMVSARSFARRSAVKRLAVFRS